MWLVELHFLGVAVHLCNLRTQKVEAEGSGCLRSFSVTLERWLGIGGEDYFRDPQVRHLATMLGHLQPPGIPVPGQFDTSDFMSTYTYI